MSSNTDVQSKPEDAIERIAPSVEENGDKYEPVRPPLNPEEFRSVLQEIDALNLTWTADIPPLLRLKDPKSKEEAFPSKELHEIQRKYPSFPTELGNVIFYALTGSSAMRSLLGDRDEVEQKVEIARELVIDQRADFCNEFFFKYAIKVPYYVDLDWEVVVKAFERNVQEMPRIPYALLSLVFRQSMSPRLLISGDPETSERETLTVAVDEHLIDKLIESLTDAKGALKKAQRIASALNDKTLDGSAE